MAVWYALSGLEILGVLEASDKHEAERKAAQRYGSQARRVQSAASHAIAEEEAAAVRKRVLRKASA